MSAGWKTAAAGRGRAWLLVLMLTWAGGSGPVIATQSSWPDIFDENPTLFAWVNGIRISYQDIGPAWHPPVILIAPLGMQHTLFGDAFVRGLRDSGFRVIAFDNRDSGLSTVYADFGTPNLRWNLLKIALGLAPSVPYTLDDMAGDVIGLLDHLQLRSTHLVGASMGGMIAQQVAIDYPERVRSLTSIMSSTGSRDLPWGDVVEYFSTLPDADAPRDVHVEYGVAYRRFDGGDNPATFDEAYVRFRIARDFDRAHHHGNETRQLLAVLAAGDRVAELPGITAPTLVVHGDRDPSLPLEHGRHTHRLIPGSTLVVIPGMGHSIEPVQVPQILEPLVTHLRASEDLVAARP